MIGMLIKMVLVFISGFAYWRFAFSSEYIYPCIVIGDFVLLVIPLIWHVFRFIFSVRKIHQTKKLARFVIIVTVWILTEIFVAFKYDVKFENVEYNYDYEYNKEHF